ncbi:MAG: TRAP transporter small permease subunit [Pseudomonadota bacterium]
MATSHAPSEPAATAMGGDLPHTLFSRGVSRLLKAIAEGLSWIWLALVAVVLINVIMRYVLGQGRIEFEEIQWHLFATGFLLGLAPCLDTDQHVRVDVFSARASPVTRAWLELYGLLLLFIPFVVAMIIFSGPFVAYSYSIGEVSGAPGGLGLRWLIKAVLPLAMTLLLLAGLSRLTRVTAYLFQWPRRVD